MKILETPAVSAGRHGELPSDDELSEKLRAGDVFVHLGYYRRPRSAYQIARSAGVAAIIESIPLHGEGLDELSKDTYVLLSRLP